MRSIYDRQADRAICEFCYENVELPLPVARQLDELRHVLAPSQVGACIGDLAARSRDPTSERLKPIQSAHTEHDLRASCLPRAKFCVASTIRLPAQPARRSGRMLSELMPVMNQLRDDIRFSSSAV